MGNIKFLMALALFMGVLWSIVLGRVRFNSVWYVYRANEPNLFWVSNLAGVFVAIVILIWG